MSDFNIIHNDSEIHGGQPRSLIAMLDFNDCIDVCGVLDANFLGSWFSWCNGHGGLDRTLCTSSALIFWLDALVKYLPRTTFDHASMVLQPSKSFLYGFPSFKFQQMWIERKSFFMLIKNGWQVEVGDSGLFQLARKFKCIKIP